MNYKNKTNVCMFNKPFGGALLYIWFVKGGKYLLFICTTFAEKV